MQEGFPEIDEDQLLEDMSYFEEQRIFLERKRENL